MHEVAMGHLSLLTCAFDVLLGGGRLYTFLQYSMSRIVLFICQIDVERYKDRYNKINRLDGEEWTPGMFITVYCHMAQNEKYFLKI